MLYKVSQDDFKGLFGSVPDGFNNDIYADVLYAQFLLESTNNNNPNGLSQLCTLHNNLYGMKPSQKREQLWNGKVQYGSEVFATYDDTSGVQSLLDRIDLDKYNGVLPPKTIADIISYMATVMAKGYATDPDYIKNWKDVLAGVSPVYEGLRDSANNVNDSVNPFRIGFWFKGIGLIVTLIAGYFVYKKYIKKK